MKKHLSGMIKPAVCLLGLMILLTGCGNTGDMNSTAESASLGSDLLENSEAESAQGKENTEKHLLDESGDSDSSDSEGNETKENSSEEEQSMEEVIEWDSNWKYAGFSKIHTGQAMLYRTSTDVKKGKIICINAGHGTSGGNQVYTLCHPDGSPKVTGGSTGEGKTQATAVAGGTTMNDGTRESVVTLKLALTVKDVLLESGYDVLMIRETEDVQLDNIARTVIANQYADCHIALHYDSSQSDKGLFYISVPDISSYRSMEPVASHWQEHHQLGDAIIDGMEQQGVKIFGDGTLALDLTQTSYSTIPSVDLEVGDRASDYSSVTLTRLAEGIAAGLDQLYGY